MIYAIFLCVVQIVRKLEIPHNLDLMRGPNFAESRVSAQYGVQKRRFGFIVSCKQKIILNKFLLSLLFSHTMICNRDKVIGCSVFDSVTKHAEVTIRDIGKYSNLDNKSLAFLYIITKRKINIR